MDIENNKPGIEKRELLRNRILNFPSGDFDALALDIFRYQAEFNPVYNSFISNLGINTGSAGRLEDIPFLPIQFFKYHPIRTGLRPPAQVTFQSSGTTGQISSRHALYDPELYKSVSTRIFEDQYGPLDQFHILALLPSYLERNNSSLVYMMQHFIDASHSPVSGFYLNNTLEMLDVLEKQLKANDGRKVLLLGVTFALLDLAEGSYDLSFLQNAENNLIVMDTGGMKGRRQELLREEVHDILRNAFGTTSVHSEYGMTELLSQGYSQGSGLFRPGFTMKVLLRDINDPFSVSSHNTSSKTGGINVIDLANLDSCSFLETQDLGRFGEDEDTFYVMGRFDNSDIRGCNLMVL